MRRLVHAIFIMTILTSLGYSQGATENTRPTGDEVAKSLHLSCAFPPALGATRLQESQLSDGTKLTRFSAGQSNNFQGELLFIHGQRDFTKIDPWGVLEAIFLKIAKPSKLAIHSLEHTWVDSLPSLKVSATKPAPGAKTLVVYGQFVLSPDGVICAQCVSTKHDKNEAAQAKKFFDSIRRPQLEKPQSYTVTLGSVRLIYPPGFFPRLKDGILHLDDPSEETGVIVRLEDHDSRNQNRIICSLAQSLNAITSDPKNSLSLMQGPGPLPNTAKGTKAWGYEGRIKTTADGSAVPQLKDVFVRYYRLNGDMVFVSAFASSAKGPKGQQEATKVVKRVIDSISAAASK